MGKSLIRLVALLITFVSFNFGAVWSSSVQDGIYQAFEEYDNRIKIENNKIVNKYSNIKNGVIKRIVKNNKLKNELLNKQKILLLNETTDKYNLELEIDRLKQLLNNNGTN